MSAYRVRRLSTNPRTTAQNWSFRSRNVIFKFTGKVTRRFPALASPDFVLFLVGQFISVTGTWMQNTAQPYLAYRISGRPMDMGIIGFASTLPTLILALPAGVLVERWDKRTTVIIFQSIMSISSFRACGAHIHRPYSDLAYRCICAYLWDGKRS